MKQLSQRQEAIIGLVQQGTHIQNKAILKELAPRFDNLSRITLVRDLNTLVKKGLLTGISAKCQKMTIKV